MALTRPVPQSIVDCQLTHISRTPIDVERARAQHAEYEDALRTCGCTVVQLPELRASPDSVFVEDVAIVLDDLAVLTRPGAPSRRDEVPPMAEALRPYRRLAALEAPATLDGGDVLVVDRTLWVGRTSRTNAEGISQLTRCVEGAGYVVRSIGVAGALHLKTAVTRVGPRHLLVNRDWVDASVFGGVSLIEVDPTEPFAANAVLIGDRVIHSTAFPRTHQRLRAAGIEVVTVDASELAKAEGGVTCCSLLVRGSEA